MSLIKPKDPFQCLNLNQNKKKIIEKLNMKSKGYGRSKLLN